MEAFFFLKKTFQLLGTYYIPDTKLPSHIILYTSQKSPVISHCYNPHLMEPEFLKIK